jgi:hypothetical protein
MAKNEKPVLGMIDCPHCGEVNGMAVKLDKNDEPFGHCEDCAGQLRVGGKPGRVRKFCRMYPWAASSAAPQPLPASAGWAAPVTKVDQTEKPVTEESAPEIPVTVTEPPKAPPKKTAAWTDVLASFNTLGKMGAPA